MNMEPITLDESKRLLVLEEDIAEGKDAWLKVGLALTEIRDRKLYRAEFATFREYCEQTWGWTDKRAYQLIAAADETSTSGRTFEHEKEARQARKERKQAEKPAQPKELVPDPVPQTASERINAQVAAAVKAHDEKQLSPEIKHLVFMLELNRDNCDGLASCVGRDGCDDDTLKDAIKKLKELATLLTVYRMSQKTEQHMEAA